MQYVDLNCDLGEGFGTYSMPNDETLMKYVTSANIACGYHAGDPHIMQKTVSLALRNGVAIGAHPSFLDIQGFGRREMKITPREAYQICLYQIGALWAFVKAAGGALHHVKPHGALYNMAAKDKNLALALAQAVYDVDPELIFYGLSGSEMITQATIFGLKTAAEVFADRTYQDDGSLTPRDQANALIEEDGIAIKQVLQMITAQNVISVNGNTVAINAQTVCLHGDGEHAVTFAKALRENILMQGITLKAP